MGQRKKSKIKKKAHISQAMFITALREAGGIPWKVAEALGMTRQAVWARLMRSEKLRKIKAEAEVAAWEHAHSNVLDLLKAKDGKTSRWYMQHSPEGKRRGWGASMEVTGKDGLPLMGNKPREITSDMPLDEATRIYMENLKNG